MPILILLLHAPAAVQAHMLRQDKRLARTVLLDFTTTIVTLRRLARRATRVDFQLLRH